MNPRDARKAFQNGLLILATIALLAIPNSSRAQGKPQGEAAQKEDPDGDHRPKIKSFSVELPDGVLTYPSYFDGLDLPDEHVTLLPFFDWLQPWKDHEVSYLLFASSKVTEAGTGGAVVLKTNDLVTFVPATDEGYAEQVMVPPVLFKSCDSVYDTTFDENYVGPGSVVQDPTLPPGNLIIIYEAENHCPDGHNQHPFYATVGFARSSDNGRTWPAPAAGEFGNEFRHPVLKDFFPEPAGPLSTESMGDGIPSAFVDLNDKGEAYVYVVYGYFAGSFQPQPTDGLIRVARAKLGNVYRKFGDDDHGRGGQESPSPTPDNQLQFYKWYKGAFSEPGIKGLDSGVLPTTGCTGKQRMAEITHNDDLGLYMMIFVCNTDTRDGTAAWFYSTATSLELQDWSVPQLIVNSQLAISMPCDFKAVPPDGSNFDGFYVSFMSPGAPAGHTKLTGRAFLLNGCDTGLPRTFASRKFTITTGPQH